MKYLKRTLGMAALTALVAAGCAQEREPINRVQANAMPKSFFVGEDLTSIEDDPEFYMRGTVIDVGYGAKQDGLFTSTYAQPVSRIRWEITENYLNARMAYERIVGTDGKGDPIEGLQYKTSNDGQVIASYHILSHFDIAPAYNGSTGEELNIIVENTSDRPWYERKYMRVDWSQNRTTDSYEFDTLAMLGVYGGIKYESVAFDIQDPSDANAPFFDEDKGYFDVTVKAFAKPQIIDLSALGWGIDSFPACWLPSEFAGGSSPVGNCNPTELTIRQSFKKVVDTDYEPVNFDGKRFNAFGLFNFAYRYGYERNYGMLDNKWFRFASRYNIWDRSHYYDNPDDMSGEVACATPETQDDPTVDPNADRNMNGTADSCEEVTAKTGMGGSQCDIFKGKCTLPLQKRQQVTIPWYLNNGDSDLFEATDWAVLEWDLALKAAIRVSRQVECTRTTGNPSSCKEQYPMWSGQQDDTEDAIFAGRELSLCRRANGYDSATCLDELDANLDKIASERGDPDDKNVAAMRSVMKMQPMIVLCHNPVIAGDNSACGAEGTKARLGDLRYNNVLIIEDPQTPSAWGIMVDADDPITGEKVAASINIWDYVTDLAVQGLVDVVRYANGELSTEEITNGDYIRNWAMASKLIGGTYAGSTMTNHEVNERLAAATKLDVDDFEQLSHTPLSADLQRALLQPENEIKDAAIRAGTPSQFRAKVNATMNLARGTPVEAELMNPAMLQKAGITDMLPMDGVVADMASPLALNNPRFALDMRRRKQAAMAKRGGCILYEAPEPTGVAGIADILIKKFPRVDGESAMQQRKRYDAMHRYLKRRYQYAVLIHEMGHSVGLRHNFVSSSAALFYRPQYWQLRTKNGAVTNQCTDAVDDGESCVGPRYQDPITQEENDNMLWMWMHSSVMDYAGEHSQDMLGLGVWDFAAARMAYGDTVPVYKDTSKYGAGTPIGVGLTNATDTFGGLIGIKYSIGNPLSFQGPEDLHYSQLQDKYEVIKNCYPVDPTPPASWDEDIDGIWDPVLDGHVVAVDGQYSKCRQMAVDYSAWQDLRMPNAAEIGGGYYRGSPSVDRDGRLRVPYAFATDHWADLGNVSVYRHDNGADPYEIAQFLINTQENRHILDNFRRNRTTFSVRGAANRSFGRYNDKLLGIGNGLGFFANIYKNFAANNGITFDTLWPYIVNSQVRDNMIASTVVFDHFVRQLTRPEDGEHFFKSAAFNDPTLRSAKDSDGNPGATAVVIPNGSTGYLRDVGFGGAPLENALSEDNGDFDSEYTMNAGSYYDKIHTAILLAESEDRFISQSRGDFYDARMRASGMADVFPDGFRRVIANSLVNDRSIMAPQLAADSSGQPLLDSTADQSLDPLARMYPAQPIGWISWWPKDGPKTCFASNGRNVCESYRDVNVNFDPDYPDFTVGVDPEIGWEVQKFMIAWTLAYISANQKTSWVDMMRIFRVGDDTPQDFEQRIEWRDPNSGDLYYALSIGKECLFGSGAACTGGKMVEKGIAARILEYANDLTSKGYQLDTVNYPATADHPAGFNTYGRAMVMTHPDGTSIIVPDAALQDIAPNGIDTTHVDPCDQNVDPSCEALTLGDNHYAYELANYKSVPAYLWQVLQTYNLATEHQLGLYP